VRHDESVSDSEPSLNPSATTDLQPVPRAQVWTWPTLLGLLMVLTILALAVTVSVWLVPPYLVLMAWLLLPSRGSRDLSREPSDQGAWPEPGVEEDVFLPSGQPEVVIHSGFVREDGGDSSDPLTEEKGSDTAVVKTKRKGRGRKAKGKAIVEPPSVSATWIQVGPGKFVRVESPTANTEASADLPLVFPDGATASQTDDEQSSSLKATDDEPTAQEVVLEREGSELDERAQAGFESPMHTLDASEQEPSHDGGTEAPGEAETLVSTSPETPKDLPEATRPASDFAEECSPGLETRDTFLNAVEPTLPNELASGSSSSDVVAHGSDTEATLWPLDPNANESECEDRNRCESEPEHSGWNEGPVQEATASLEEVADAPAEATEPSDRFAEMPTDAGFAPTEEGSESEVAPFESWRDQGNALEALSTERIVDFEEDATVVDSEPARSPSAGPIISLTCPRETPSFPSPRFNASRLGLANSRSVITRRSKRERRSLSKPRAVRSNLGSRTRRGSGSYRAACRTFPPRSPPVRWPID